MIRIEILFDRQSTKNLKSGTLQALQNEIEQRLKPHYPEIWLRIDQGSAPSVSVTGARNDKDKERIMSLPGRQLAACSMSTVYHRPADPSGDDSYVRPLFADRCQAGFPSPATDYAEQELDLNSYCISRPAATFFLRASGESMNQAGVQNGDLLVVDRAEKPQHGDIVIAEIDGEFTVKRLLLRPRPALEPVSDSPEFRTLYPENICIFGVVTHVIHRTRESR